MIGVIATKCYDYKNFLAPYPMVQSKVYVRRFYDGFLDYFFRFAASGYVPPSLFLPAVPSAQYRSKKTGRLHIEVVSHCWNYSHMLAYQLSSLINHPPQKTDITMTVFYCEEDLSTVKLLNFIAGHQLPNITWNWQPLPRTHLFRRAIGRNKAALSTTADWVWFADCDIIFKENCLDSLCDALQGRNDKLVFPSEERTTGILDDSNPLLQKGKAIELVDIPNEGFTSYSRKKATGEFQITHGDVARATGYCANLSIYHTPSEHWCKCREDRAFRWLLRDHGTAIPVENLYQIRHSTKGRYKKGSWWSVIRGKIRQLTTDTK